MKTTTLQEAGRDERVDDGPRATTGPQHDGRLGHLLVAHQRLEGGPEAEHLGVVADELGAVRVTVSTAPVRWASSVRRSSMGTTRSLCGHADAGAQVLVAAQGRRRPPAGPRWACRRARTRRRCRRPRRPPAGAPRTASGRPGGREGRRAWAWPIISRVARALRTRGVNEWGTFPRMPPTTDGPARPARLPPLLPWRASDDTRPVGGCVLPSAGRSGEVA